MPLWKKKVSHPTAPNLYTYQHHVAPTAGAAEFTFNPEFTLPAYVFRGAGRIAGALNVFQARVSHANLAIPMRGIPTVAGQIMFQGLSASDAIQQAQSAQVSPME
jgi:hypothetical protein